MSTIVSISTAPRNRRNRNHKNEWKKQLFHTRKNIQTKKQNQTNQRKHHKIRAHRRKRRNHRRSTSILL